MRVLVVDDEIRYREYLGTAIEAWGHEVRTADDGAKAIDDGIQFRPEVLITDWMLRHHIHGLHVSGALTSIDPRLQTILITGFDSSELRRDAERGRVLQFLSKPFGLTDIESAIKSARRGAEVIAFPIPFGVVRVAGNGEIAHINDKAWEMFAETDAGRCAKHLSDLFAPETLSRVTASEGRWYAVRPKSPRQVMWWTTCRPLGDESLCLFIPERDNVLKHDTRVRLLMGDRAPDPEEWPFADQVLVVDSDPGVMRLHVAQLETLGCTAYRTDDADLAIRILEANPEIGVVVFDRELPGCDPEELVARLNRARPGVKLVGNDRSGDPSTFRALGIDRFLAKPWRVTDLVRVLDPDGRPGSG